jgi:hypothetical protein
MSAFSNYLTLGYEHIASLDATDHIVFIVALVATFQLKNWLKIIIAVTFFTLGHSISLTLGALNVIKIESGLIEFLIPATILFTALFNLSKAGQNQNGKGKNWLALLFGVIHGLGFSNYYSVLVVGNASYWEALLPFNLGVELGQLAVVAVLLLVLVVYEFILNKKHRDWNLFISGAAFGLALLMCIENWPFEISF